MKKFRKGKGEKPSFLKRGDDEMEEEEFFPVGVAEGERDEGSGGGRGRKKGGPREKSKKCQQKVLCSGDRKPCCGMVQWDQSPTC